MNLIDALIELHIRKNIQTLQLSNIMKYKLRAIGCEGRTLTQYRQYNELLYEYYDYMYRNDLYFKWNTINQIKLRRYNNTVIEYIK